MLTGELSVPMDIEFECHKNLAQKLKNTCAHKSAMQAENNIGFPRIVPLRFLYQTKLNRTKSECCSFYNEQIACTMQSLSVRCEAFIPWLGTCNHICYEK